MHLPSATSANTVTDFMGTSFMLCLLGGFLADSLLGRYKTIIIFSIVQTLVSAAVILPLIFRTARRIAHLNQLLCTIYVQFYFIGLYFFYQKLCYNTMVQGTAMLAIATRLPQLHPAPCKNTMTQYCKKASGFQMGILYFSLYLIAVGTGGLKSSVSGFGSDQFDEKDEKEKNQMTYFFSRFFFFVSIGTLMAVTFLVYIQDEVGRSWAYGICSVSMFIAILIFLSGTKRYRYKKISGSPIVYIVQVIVAALRKRKLELPPTSNLLHEESREATRICHTDQFRFLDRAAIIMDERERNGSIPNPWKLCPVTQVEEVKMMIKLLPIWATTIMFWTVYAQMITFSVEQASTMKRSIGDFQIPAGSLTVFLIGAILISLAVYDRVITPAWKRWTGKLGFTSLQRIAIGLIFSVMGMAAAALAEVKRRSVAKAGEATSSTLPISVFLLIPQFFLVGSGEDFIYSGQLDFFITQSPRGMKTMSTGIFLSTLSLGFFVSSLLVLLVKRVTGSNHRQGWLADNINEGRLDCFYGLVALLSFINFGVYILCAKKYKQNTTQESVNGSYDEERSARIISKEDF